MKSILVGMHATKELQGGRGGEWLRKHKEDTGSQPNCLELRLGVSSSDDCTSADHVVATSSGVSELLLARSVGPKLMFLTNLEDGFNSTPPPPPPPAAAGTKRWLPETAAVAACGGFVHPWSLAARQQKAAYEQAHHIISCSNPSSSTASLRFAAAPPTVGWPPVRAFRRNIVGSQTTNKPEMKGEKEAKKSKVSREEEEEEEEDSTVRVAAAEAIRATLFVKVNMEGFAVGRKINLKAHHSYDSLSRALQRMFNNFLSANYNNNSFEEEQDDSHKTDYILLYEDHEGDRMLVGDVPWEMFITTVKRLHIAHNPKARKSENKKDQRDDDMTEQ